jgi:iron complex transport system substrate-binding protein
MSAAGRDRLKEMPGLAETRWASVPGQALLHPGPALGRGLEQLVALVHPEAGR